MALGLNHSWPRSDGSGEPADYEIFQSVFGAVFTVLIALEFKHSLLVPLPSGESVVQVRSVILIALLALVRKFIIIDVKTVQPTMVGAIAAATLSLGMVYWLIRNSDPRGKSRPDEGRAPDGVLGDSPRRF